MKVVDKRVAYLCASAIPLGLVLSNPALAQSELDQVQTGGLQEIIVTAQKREQSLQDVPIAVTALGEEALAANRVMSVNDLTGLAPGLVVAESGGGQKIPFFIMRGANSAGLVPGSDKQVSLYLDGVYLGSTRGSIFDLPDVERIEVLRGPQGTLFGRNATAGAVSVSTRNPTGDIGVRATASVGNYDHYRFGVSVDSPQIGPFSGYVSAVHNYRRGDIRNVAAGERWDRRNSLIARPRDISRSVDYLGTTDSTSVFAALKFEIPDFTTVYKFDWNEDTGSTRGTALVGYDPQGLLGGFLDTLIRTQPVPVPIAPDAKRPKAVSNGFVVPSEQESQGHSLTSTYQISDSLSVRNIFAFRKSYIFGPGAIDGVSSLTITPESILPFATLAAYSSLPPDQAPGAIPDFVQQLTPLIGSPYVAVSGAPTGRSQQYSDEIQFNYTSELLTATVGGVWFQGKDWVNEHGFWNTITFAAIPNGEVPNENIGINYNKAVSLAGYAQLEFHLTPQLDLVGGIRVTRDKKTGTFTFGRTLDTLTTVAFEYKKTKPTYLVGVNWKPTQDTLLYGKFSTGFVSGGSVAGIPFAPETVTSWEAGIKADLFNRKLRTNLALFHASYKHVQGPSAPTTPEARDFIDRFTGNPAIKDFVGTFVADLGNIKAKGFELDVTAAPLRGVTLGGSLAYTDTDYAFINPLQIGSDGVLPVLNNRPPWTASLFGQYDSPPIGMGDAYLSIRSDASWQDSYILTTNPTHPIYASFGAPIRNTPSYWLINGRVSLRDLDLGGVKTELAGWVRNLTDERALNSGLNLSGILASASFIPARTYGVDLTIQF